MLNKGQVPKLLLVGCLILLSLPSGACACIDDSNIHMLVKIFLGLAYFIFFPFALFALSSQLNLGAKVFGVYVVVLILSVASWAVTEYLVLVLPLLPFIAMVVWLRKQPAHV